MPASATRITPLGELTKLLVVEDHAGIRDLLAAELQWMRFVAITAENSQEGVETTVAEKPDFILMDILMPEATRILRGKSRD
jgi:DNA-binding response OmpR family regulator